MVQPHGTSNCCCCNIGISEICFEVLCFEADPDVEPECENAIRISATVISVHYGSIVSPGDEIVIADPRHVHFNVPIESLIGATGTAVYYHAGLESDWGTIDENCAEYDLMKETECRWIVTSMKTCANLTKDEIMFRVLSNAPVVRTDINGQGEIDYGLRVWAEVIEIPCNTTQVAMWDKIIVWDLDFDKFDLPISVLLGGIGTARWVVDSLPLETPYCIDYVKDCRWVVQSLVCNEELYLCD